MENQNVNPFAEESWSESPVKTEEQPQEQAAEETETQQENVETEENLEQEAEQQEAGFSYENELSAQIHQALLEGKHEDVYSFLEKKTKIEKLSNAEIKDRQTAEEIVKTSMRLKYSDLTDDEINYKFNRLYKLPKEPQQSLTETDEEFKERMDEYNQKIQDINTELMIEAKTVKPEIAKFNTEIKLPGLGPKSKSPEDLAQQQAYIENYLKTAESTINDFNGINVEYKDEGISFNSGYTPSVEERQQIANMMSDLAESEFDANSLFAERWVNDDYTLNTKQIAEDLWFFQNKDRIVQKLVNDAVSKRISEYRKQTSNISVGGNQANFTPGGEKTDLDKMAEHFFSN